MDKYQEYAFNKIFVPTLMSKNEKLGTVELVEGNVHFIQNEDYNVINYKWPLKNVGVEKIEIYNNCWNPSDKEPVINFNSPFSKIRISFVNNVCKSIEFDAKFIVADKNAYDSKKAEELRISRVKQAEIKVSTANSLINVVFQPVTENYSYSKVELYTNEGKLMGKFRSGEDMYFIAINNLAYGTYRIKLVQYDANNNVILSSDTIQVSLRSPNYGGKPTIVI